MTPINYLFSSPFGVSVRNGKIEFLRFLLPTFCFFIKKIKLLVEKQVGNMVGMVGMVGK
jgi:hypothetical protein